MVWRRLGPSNPEYESRKFDGSRLFRQRDGMLEENGSFAGGSADLRAKKTNNNIEANEDGDYQENIETAKMINLVGMIAFVIVLLIFNIAFWVSALTEQTTPGIDFLKTVTDIFWNLRKQY